MEDIPMHYDGNFSKEEKQLDTIDESLKTNLEEIVKTLEELQTSGAWKDEKSAAFISEASSIVSDIQNKRATSIASGKQILSKVSNAFEIYK